jgi:MoxR-like ATPase
VTSFETQNGLQGLASFGPVLTPDQAEEPILAKPVRAALLEWLTEIWAKDALAEVGLTARKRAIFHGAPGTGKTTLAHHLAARLGLPMLKVRADKLQSKYLSESGRLIGMLFDALAKAPPVFLFFDEFDSLAAKRMNSGHNPTAEQDHNHAISVLLAAFDRYDGFIVAATNLGERVDEAVWRRFEIQIKIDVPGDRERREIIKRYLAPFVLPPRPLELMSEALGSASPALIRQVCEHVKRQIVIGPLAEWDMAREAVFSRLIASIEPHPDLGKPRLWSHGADDLAVRNLPWPLEKTLADYPADEPAPDGGAAVVDFSKRRRP